MIQLKQGNEVFLDFKKVVMSKHQISFLISTEVVLSLFFKTS